jgi:hypothetical protein
MGRVHVRLLATTLASGAIAWSSALGASTDVSIPMTCTRGPSGQRFTATATFPANVPEGATYTLRVDGTDSGTVGDFGLRYLHDIGYTLRVSGGASYVEGSARVVPDTGTPNVRPGARVSVKDGLIHLLLPAHVEKGSRYTEPSIELSLKATAGPGTKISYDFVRYRLTAKAIVVGDVEVKCDPSATPAVIGTTLVTPAAVSP